MEYQAFFIRKCFLVVPIDLYGSWARVGRYLPSDRYGMGPQYTSENIGWSGSWIPSSYNQYATATRPYTFGWVGFGVKWPYADKAEVGMRFQLVERPSDVGFCFLFQSRQGLVGKGAGGS